MAEEKKCPHCHGPLNDCAQWSDVYLSWVCENTDELIGGDDDIAADDDGIYD